MPEDTPDTQAEAPEQSQSQTPDAPATKDAPKAEQPKGKEGKPSKEAPAKGPSPWEKGLDEALGSEDPRTALDSMFRDTQGRLTQYEQRASVIDNLFGHYENPDQMMEMAGSVVNTVMADPYAGVATLIDALANDPSLDLDPEDLIFQMAEYFGIEGDDDGEYDEDDMELDDDDMELDEESEAPDLEEHPLFQRVSDFMEEQESQEVERQYNEILDKLDEHFDGSLDRGRFSRLVELYEGDIELAVEDYRDNWHTPPPAPLPPNPSQGARPAPREQKQYRGKEGMRDAIDDFLAELR